MHSRALTAAAALLLVASGCSSGTHDRSAVPPRATASVEAAETATVTQTPEPQRGSAEQDTRQEAALAAPDSALAAVDELRVKGRAPKTGYDRDRFAYREHDLDRNGCDVRNDVLRRDLIDVQLKPGTNGCVVETATLHDPYSGALIEFTRGTTTSHAVQIDHVVALSDAWQKGAQQWEEATRHRFGNDPLNLIAVDGPLNARKGDGDTATWLPPNKAFRCEYVARQVSVKRAYDLWVTEAERDAMVRVLSSCPEEPLLEADRAPVLASAPAEPATTPPPEQAMGDTDPRFGSCRAAIAEGYGPYVDGEDTEYGWYRDGDSDGTVCER